MKKILIHFPHWASLLGVAIFALIGLIIFSYDQNFQKAIIFSFAASYVSWGIIHHYLHENLQVKVLTEYVLVTIIGVIVLLSVISM